MCVRWKTLGLCTQADYAACLGLRVLTAVHSSDTLEWAGDEHANSHHGEVLDARAGHVEHDCVHGQRLSRRVGEFPRFGHLKRCWICPLGRHRR